METGVKRIFYAVATIALLVISAVYLVWAYHFPLIRVQTTSPRTLVVSGEGKVEAKPNVAIIQAAIEIEGKTPELVQQTNDDRIRVVVAFLKGQGVVAADIQTTDYNLSPTYFYPPNRKPELSGYTLVQGLKVKVRDLAKAGSIMGALTGKGVNRINGISFEIDKPEQFLAEARIKAIANAREQAEQIAKGLGVKLGRVQAYAEGSVSFPPPVPMRMMSLESAVGGPSPIEPGSQEERVNVTITFELQ